MLAAQSGKTAEALAALPRAELLAAGKTGEERAQARALAARSGVTWRGK